MAATEMPLLILGAGHMGGALIKGWERAGALRPLDLIIRDPAPGSAALDVVRAGATLNGPVSDIARARTVVLAVKPASWRDVAVETEPHIAADAVLISVMAGVAARDLMQAFPGRPVARVMPTTAAAALKGAVSVWATDVRAREAVHRLFEPLGHLVELRDEAEMHAATAASGSAPAYFFAMVEALEAGAREAGLAPGTARSLARSALIGAAALLEESGEDAAVLRRQVTSPGGTTEAALRVLSEGAGLDGLVSRAVRAAQARSLELGA